MVDALTNTGMMTSPLMYGGIGVAMAVIGGFIFLFRRQVRLQLEQENVKAAYSIQQEQKDFAVKLENLPAPDKADDIQVSSAPGTANDLQVSNAPAEAEQQPIEDTSEQDGVDIAQTFRAAEPSASEDENEETQTPEPTDDNSGDKPPEKQKSEDAMFDLFTTEIEDDSNVGKLAASLDNVDINDIMTEAQSLLQKLRGGS